MTYQTIALSGGEVATLRLVAKKGSMAPLFWEEMADALPKLNEARVLIVRGEDIFSAGLDVAAYAPTLAGAAGNLAEFRKVVAPMHAAIEGLAGLDIPVIAAVHGWCVGAGLELVAACDLRLCSAEARFSLPEVSLGIVADLGGLQRLPQLIGLGWTQRLALTAEPITAAKAEQLGLVSEVLDTHADLFARAEVLAAHLLTLPAEALNGTKRVLNDALPHAEGLIQAVDWNAEHLRPEVVAAALKRR